MGVPKTLIIAGREFRGFLRMPLGYVLLAVYALVSGMALVTLLFLFHDQLQRLAQQAMMATPSQAVIDVQLSVLTPYLFNTAALLLFIVPFLTMRAFAEEKRSRSLEVLVSYPLSAWQIVLGKFLGVYAFMLLLLAITAGHLAILAAVSTPEILPVVGGFAGLLLLGAALVAIGLFISSLTVGQVEAAVLTLGLFLVLVMAGEMAGPGATMLQSVMGYVSPLYQYQGFGRGVLAFDAVLSYAAATLLYLALTLRGVDLLKWRG